MGSGLSFLGNLMPLVAAALFLISLIPAANLVEQLAEIKARRQWRILIALIVLFVVGSIGFSISNWNQYEALNNLIAPLVLLLFGFFSLLVCLMSFVTARELISVGEYRHQAITDPLLGVFNRRYLMERLREECQRAHRYDLELSLLMIDVDHFKELNDKYGHPVGDKALVALASVLLATVRETDIVARYGGEELVVVAPNSDLAAASELAERTRQAIEFQVAKTVSRALTSPLDAPITVSIGVAPLSRSVGTAETLVTLADQALYSAKDAGRNRVITNVI